MLKPLRQVQALNIDFITINTSERGGILTIGSVSGLTIAQYAVDPAEAVPIGVQYNDVEYRDSSRQPFVYGIPREVEVPYGIVGIATDGDYITDWIQASGTIINGDRAYVGPSGLITNNASLGGYQIGYFLGPLTPDPHVVIFSGKGFHREKMDPDTKRVVQENDPANRVFVLSDGFIKVRLNTAFMIRSQAGG
jgi:hypothetical protein